MTGQRATEGRRQVIAGFTGKASPNITLYRIEMPRSRVRKAARYGLKRPWSPARHRELILYLVGLGLVGTCVLVPTFHYWEYFRAERAFAVDAGRGKSA